MNKFFDYILLTVGAAIVAMGLEMILVPNVLVDDGVTALSIMQMPCGAYQYLHFF
jgi:uncharacterized membrane-anchored protein YitT (DUF2179 family)